VYFAPYYRDMADFDEMRNILARIQGLENKIGRQVFQLKGLMSVTQAINENVGADALFEMLGRFLSFEMQIRRFTLLFKEGPNWKIVSNSGTDISAFNTEELNPFLVLHGPGTKKIMDSTHPFVKQFEYGLQVMHKSIPLAYLFMADFHSDDDVVGQLDFVTAVTNVVAVAIENKRLFKEQVNQKLINRELELAAEIQQALVPRRLPSGVNYEMSSIYKPHFAVGGDYYDVVEFPDNKVAFCIADITGKGVSAALLMANFQANFHALVPRRPSLEEIVHEMNAAVHRVTDGDRFITLFLGKYDLETHTLHYVNAGHTPPFLIMSGQVVRLCNGTTVLGWLPELPFLEIGGVCLTTDALLFTYTDGLTDVRNAAGEDFSEEILEAFLVKNAHLPAKELNSKLLLEVEAFKGEEPYPDDITVLSCRIFK
jgi:sigma-B regulation protein RsbU (phosphoserine phosphatase)